MRTIATDGTERQSQEDTVEFPAQTRDKIGDRVDHVDHLFDLRRQTEWTFICGIGAAMPFFSSATLTAICAVLKTSQ